ncbi:MAG: serine/threonine protein phosphatase [Nannocystis sp.]|nr:hypothetical protein [Nannocystis sp.]MBA3550300.1 serine/threonine protein phosphatase [Nannocystis sp.]
MTLRIDRMVAGREDRATHFTTSTGGVLVVADGAGGTGDGAHAAEAVIAAVAANLDLHDADDWAALLAVVDATLRNGETTAVVASITGDEIHGASVGDSGAWLIGAHGYDELTQGQRRKPLIGSGRATPVPFTSRLGAATLLLASDGLLNYAPAPRITALATMRELTGLAHQLCDLVRLRSGTLPDDVAILLARAGPSDRKDEPLS